MHFRFDRFLIKYDLCVFTCIIFIFVFRCTHVRMSYVLNSYLLTYLPVTTVDAFGSFVVVVVAAIIYQTEKEKESAEIYRAI